MKRDFTPENIERFLKESADDLQMRPSDEVWDRISGRMNRRRRWVFFTSAFFLVTVSLFGYYIIDQSKTPGNPFATIQTVQKKAVAKPQSNNTHTAATNNSSTSTIAVGSRPVVTSFEKNRNAVITNERGHQLFQNPMLHGADDLAAYNLDTAAFTPTVVDEYAPFENAAPVTTLPESAPAHDPLTIESVVNAYQRSAKKRKSEFLLFFTPTVSYRRLTENKSYLRAVPQNQAGVNLAALYDVNTMVTHKPDLGLELGFAFKFPVTNRIKLRTGMQFNINRYDIKAFTYVPERTTITLNTRIRGVVDSVNTMSNYRNFNGGQQDWLQNLYFQVSTPVGVEVALGNATKTQFGVATTIQPTYVLGDRAYLISTDYKNYSQVPWLMRRWNVNTSLEAFVSYSTGKLRWQVGPQVRYQLLSSFVEKYPVKENLFDFGMKVGVSLDKK